MATDYGEVVQEPHLMPAFGAQVGWSPDRECGTIHGKHGMKEGSDLVCMQCHKTGIPDHPALQRHAKDRNGSRSFPRPDPKPDDPAVKEPKRPPTRRERRAAAFKVTTMDPDKITRLLDGGRATKL